jgi:predicted TPR repeat methyltransferase
VDLSPRMVQAAGQRGLYAELHEADLPAFLAREQRRFPLVLAGDVLPYFGDLAGLFRAVAAVLAPGGRFLCSVEALAQGGGWQLGPLGRYRHAPAYLAAAAAGAGLAVGQLAPEIIREEDGVPIPGLLAVLEGPAA